MSTGDGADPLALFALNGRVALVTGASRGIGRAIAAGLQAAGAQVFGAARSASPLSENGAENGSGNGPGEEPSDAGLSAYISCDVTDPQAVDALLRQVEQRAGRLDILVNAAGISLSDTAVPDSAARFAATLDANLRGPFLVCSAAYPLLRRSKGGSIINVTSIGAHRGFPGNPGYVAAKSGLAGLTRALAVDWAADGIRVNNLVPGYVRTAMTEASHADRVRHVQRLRHMLIPRWGDPSDLVGPAVFLASPASAYVTGQDVVVDGGWLTRGLNDD